MAASGLQGDRSVVAHWLYRFGSVPRGPTVERDFGPDDEPMGVLGLTVGGRVRRLLETAYVASSLQGWYSFARTPAVVQIAAACKLYVSPRPEALADAFPRIADTFVQSEVRSFKVGRGIEGLLRSDKIVAYFEDPAHMEAVASALNRALEGYPAQGVPFTAELSSDGLLSWGTDPPAGNAAASWRAWVTQRLATSLTASLASPRGDPVEAALADMRTAGVDPDRWLPGADAFRHTDQQ
jgi:hypothetical protein